MMKRIVFLCVIGLVITSNCFAMGGMKRSVHMSNSPKHTYDARTFRYPELNKFPNGVTFYVDYEESKYWSLTAGWSKGSNVSDFTVTRATGPKPATYIDENGKVQTIATDNTPRINSCLYDSTGLLTNKKGLIVEASSTNLIEASDNLEHVSWSATDVTAVGDSADVIGIYGTNLSSKLTGGAVNSSIANTSAADASSLYTFSIYARTNTGSNTVNLYAYDDDAQLESTAMALTTSWKRFSVTITTGGAATQVICQIGGGDTFSTNEVIYVMGCQFEKQGYATSLIPTTTASASRGTTAEVLKYLNAGNRTAAQETIFIKWISPASAAVGNPTAQLLASDSKNRYVAIGGNEPFSFRPNITDSINCFSYGGTVVKDTSAVYAFVMKHSAPYAETYKNGSSVSKDNDDNFIDNAWGTYWYLGCNTSGANQIHGIIQKVLIFDRALSSSEDLTVSQWLEAN